MLVKTTFIHRPEYKYIVKSWSYKNAKALKADQEKTALRAFYIDLDNSTVTSEPLAEKLLNANCEILFEQHYDPEIDESNIPNCYLLINNTKVPI